MGWFFPYRSTVGSSVHGTNGLVVNKSTGANFGAAYPRQTFTAVNFRSAASRFTNPQQWEGKRVRVTGKVRLYRDRPEIVLEASSQLAAAP